MKTAHGAPAAGKPEIGPRGRCCGSCLIPAIMGPYSIQGISSGLMIYVLYWVNGPFFDIHGNIGMSLNLKIYCWIPAVMVKVYRRIRWILQSSPYPKQVEA